MSMKVLSVAVLLLALCLYGSFAEAIPPAGRHAGNKSRMCCVSVTSANISRNVTGNKYREQMSKKPCVHAIIFSTTGGQVCANPRAKWVQQLIANMTKE